MKFIPSTNFCLAVVLSPHLLPAAMPFSVVDLCMVASGFLERRQHLEQTLMNYNFAIVFVVSSLLHFFTAVFCLCSTMGSIKNLEQPIIALHVARVVYMVNSFPQFSEVLLLACAAPFCLPCSYASSACVLVM